jgi:hypothetical protein
MASRDGMTRCPGSFFVHTFGKAFRCSEMSRQVDHEADAEPDDHADKPVAAAGQNGADLARAHHCAVESAGRGAADRRKREGTVVALLDAMQPDLPRAQHMGASRLLRAAMRATRCTKGDRSPAIMTGDQFLPRLTVAHACESNLPESLFNFDPAAISLRI